MKTTLAIRPEFSEFDIYRALSWIKNEADWVSLRFAQEHTHQRTVRNQRPENNAVTFDRGVMVEAMVNGQIAYAGTSDLSEQGLREAARRASRLARVSATFKTMHFSEKHRPKARGRFISQHLEGLDTQSLGEFTDRLVTASRHLKVSDKIVNTSAEATLMETWLRYASSNGADIDERFLLVSNNFAVTAQDGTCDFSKSMSADCQSRCQREVEVEISLCQRVARMCRLRGISGKFHNTEDRA